MTSAPQLTSKHQEEFEIAPGSKSQDENAHPQDSQGLASAEE
jgi:hypothetical protein